MHCGKAFKRSRLWEPESWPAADERPRMGAVLRAHMETPGPDGRAEHAPDEDSLAAGLEEAYRLRLWHE